MMKKFYSLFASALLFAGAASAQIGATAPDFTVTDIEGNEHNLYTYLDAGKVVILDCSATWCPPCWTFHQNHYLKSLDDQFGPKGTDQVVVLFYEADASTNSDDLNGTGSNTQGDWVTGVEYPIIDPVSPSLSGSVYWPLGYPTVNVISPNDKKIKADLFNNQVSSVEASLTSMIETVSAHFAAGVGVEEQTLSEIALYPNPTADMVNLNFTAAQQGTLTIEVTNVLGQIVHTETRTAENGSNSVAVNLSSLNNGYYTLLLTDAANNRSQVSVQISK